MFECHRHEHPQHAIQKYYRGTMIALTFRLLYFRGFVLASPFEVLGTGACTPASDNSFCPSVDCSAQAKAKHSDRDQLVLCRHTTKTHLSTESPKSITPITSKSSPRMILASLKSA